MIQADTQPRAVVLLSGGLDSTTCLAMAKAQGFECHALSVLYGQRHQVEIQAARRVAQALGAAQHREIGVDLSAFGGSALTADIEVPKGRSEAEMSGGIPITYVPARNTVFLSLALAWAEALDSTDLFIGVNALDYSGYPDCRPEFIMAFENLANLATKMSTTQGRRIKIHAPLIRMTKAQIIQAGLKLGVDYGLTHSCYDPAPDGRPCGQCDSCLLRAKGFAEAGTADPVLAP
ncbi:MAG: 7-cyano-7-deazaguanine synthase QueC [Proteobacteria bacterium]|nr:7-cyano-7-deazaguanine synthase QueC [Pseudomonadota bacterium]MBU4384947.1 7-cyano-7-deazaguanine synthase QueC [Pseudomonadota bacterium]MBU4605913.1 7-cyano-7-deazaguanine synthase QueC [Pseudomonadota bacterium]MCG2766082.1 7-cyano-7-deazaguanine synthase QueC [Desulfarculaceae bacterium]